MKDMRAARANEKLKGASTLLGNGGLALLVAGFTRLYAGRLELIAGAWIFIAAGLIWIAVQMNDLLDSDDL